METRQAYDFGRQADLTPALVRNRLGLEIRAASWLKVAGMVQDTRAPQYLRPRPGSAQDPFDLHEAYLDFRPDRKSGWGATVGRKRFAYKDWIVVGLPEWSNSGRTYDTAQLNYLWSGGQLHLISASNVQFDAAGFNKPHLTDLMSGAYLETKKWGDFYFFRHDRPTANTRYAFGTRLEHKFGDTRKGVAEIIGQNGAYGMVLTGSQRVGRTEFVVDFEFFTPTYDKLYAALHNRFGHTDLYDSRNIQSLQPMAKWTVGKHTKLFAMYTANWVVDSSKPVYTQTGGPIAPKAGAGSFIGQEAAVYSTHQWGHFQLGFALAHAFHGGFVKASTPGKGTTYAYVHAGYLF